MAGVLTGFAVIGVIILVGYIVGRTGILGEHARFVLSRIVFSVLSPCLLLTVLADANVHVLFSRLLIVSFLAAVACFALFAVVALALWRRPITQVVVGSLAAGYTNANNIGVPVAVYVLGNAAYSAPVVLLQLLVFTPVALGILDAKTRGSVSVRRILLQPVTNPLTLGSALGVIISVTGVHVPDPIFEPFRLIGEAAVPLVLISFGMSLSGARLLQPGSGRRDVLYAAALKVAGMPAIAWALGEFVFGLRGHDLFVVTALAALPSAQNVFNYAQRYERGEVIARDAVLITTLASVPALLLVSALLAS